MKHLKWVAFAVVAVISADIYLAIAGTDAKSISVYSSRKEYLIEPLLTKFTEQTGIEVKLLTGKDDALIARLDSEGKNSPADLLITADAGRLYRAKVAGLLQPVKSLELEKNIPENLRDTDNQWFGLSMRSRVIMYNKNKVSADELSTYEALTDPKWKGRICIRSSDNIYNQSLLASMIASNGEQAAETWAKAIVANMARPPKGNDRAQMSAAVVGECDLAIANTYYYASWLTSDKPQDQENASQLAIFFPNQNDRGAHVNVSGAGVTRYSKNSEEAIQLLEFLSSEEAQEWYAQVNNEYPVRPGVATSELVQSWGYPFKADSLNLSRLGELNATAVKVFDRSGWK